MRNITAIVLLMVTILVGVPVSYGQSSSSETAQIQRLREEIRKRETAEAPPDLSELNRSILIQRRAELRTLLTSQIVKLQKHRTELGSFITPEESQKINDLVQAFNAEVDRLSVAMQKDLATSNPSRSDSAGTRAPTRATAPSDGNTSTAGAVGNGRTAVSGGISDAVVSDTSSNTGAVVAPATAMPAVPQSDPLKPGESKATLDCEKVLNQTTASSELDLITCGLIREIKARSVGTPNTITLGSTDLFELVKILIAKSATPAYLVEASEVRLDKQLGASAVNGVSPSLVTRGGVPTILSFAVENGGLTQTSNDTAITFRGNPVGLFNALKNRGFVPSVKEDENDPVLRFLKKTSFAFTFNTDRGPQPGVFTGSRQQLSSISARVELINKRVPTLYIREWEDFLGTKAQNLTNVINESVFVASDTGKWIDPAMQTWFEQTQGNLAAASDDEVSGVLQAALDKLPIKDLRPETLMLLERIEKALGLYMSGRGEILDKINNGTILTFEYLNKREVNAPDTSNFTVIAEKGTAGGKVNFTFNGSLTMFNNLDSLKSFVNLNPTLPKPRRVRDFQFSGQMDIPFGNVREFGQFVFFAGGRYERLLENATTELGQILPNTTGDIGHFQMGLKIPVAKTGFKIPVSITFANRTELIKEKTVKGNFGFSLDLDTLFSKFKPF